MTSTLARAKAEGWDHYIVTRSDELAVERGYYVDLEAADHVCQFFPRFLIHAKGKRHSGQPFELLPWQRDKLLRPLFGWKQPDGLRRFRTAFVFTPKKQGKSTLAAGVGLYLMCADREPGAEVYSAAADKGQARIVHDEAIRMVQSSPDLSQALIIHKGERSILWPALNAKYQAISSGSESKHGLNIHGAICDEIHAWYGSELWDTLYYGGEARDEPLIFCITTAGSNLESLAGDLYKKSKAILANDLVDPEFFPLIYEADPSDDWTSEETWHKAMPSLGETISVERIRRRVEAAKGNPKEERRFKWLMLNQWSSPEHVFIERPQWHACLGEFTADSLAGATCYGGFDLGVAHDLTSLCLTFPDDDFRQYRQLYYFWTSQGAIARMEHLADFLGWGERGLVTICDGAVVDYDQVVNDMISLLEPFDCREIAYDPYGPTGMIFQKVEEETGIERFSFRQGWLTMSPAIMQFERAVHDQAVQHNGHEILTWQLGHCVASTDNVGNKRLVKPKQGDHRTIDGVVAAVMSYMRAQDNKHNQRRWYYEDADVTNVDLT